jgi:hypothetical protein
LEKIEKKKNNGEVSIFTFQGKKKPNKLLNIIDLGTQFGSIHWQSLIRAISKRKAQGFVKKRFCESLG